MKFLLSWLKDYLELSVHPEVMAQRLTEIGLEVNHLSKIEPSPEEGAKADWLFEAEVTPNRPDLLSHLGIARETAVALGRSFRFPRWLKREFSVPRRSGGNFPVVIEDPKSCKRYCGIVIEGVRVGPSPAELVQRLERVGIRSLNNVVDSTNFVLMELGQPLHAFDLDRLESEKIIIRRAKPGEKLTLIDGTQQTLSPELLVIADAKQPVALAGVMGGKETEITAVTRRVFLESAWFDPAMIRRATRLTKITSDSAYRFERGVDGTLIPSAALRAARIILKHAGGTMRGGIEDVGSFRSSRKRILFRPRKAQEILGMRIYPSQQRRFLERVGCQIRGNAKSLQVDVPFWRPDLKGPEDLYEELARLWGYDRCPPTLSPTIRRNIAPAGGERQHSAAGPLAAPARASKGAAARLVDRGWEALEDTGFRRQAEIRKYLAAAGLQEVLTYSLLSREQLLHCRWLLDEPNGAERPLPGPVTIQNPLSNEQALLRPLLLPGLLESASRNFRKKTAGVLRFFEMGWIYDPRRTVSAASRKEQMDLHPAGRRSLAILLAGTPEKQWAEQTQPLGIFHLKGIVRFLCERLALPGYQEQISELGPRFLAGKTLAFELGKQPLGMAGKLDPAVLAEYEIPEGVEAVYAQLDLDRFLELSAELLRVKPLAKVAPVIRDLAVILSEEVPHAEVRQTIFEAGKPLLQEAVLFDLYRGKQISAGKKSLAFRLLFSDKDRTLTDEEVLAANQKIFEQLQAAFKATAR